jgi:hypothetical protein
MIHAQELLNFRNRGILKGDHSKSYFSNQLTDCHKKEWNKKEGSLRSCMVFLDEPVTTVSTIVPLNFS